MLYRSTDAETFKKVNKIFINDTVAQLIELKEIIGKEHFAAAADLAHQVKGAASAVGGGEFAGVCSKLEVAAEAGDREKAEDLLESGNKAFSRLRKAIQIAIEKSGEGASN